MKTTKNEIGVFWLSVFATGLYLWLVMVSPWIKFDLGFFEAPIFAACSIIAIGRFTRMDLD